MQYTKQNKVIEIAFKSTEKYNNPFNDIELDCIIKSGAKTYKVPCFWAGDNFYKVRFASNKIGKYTYETVCSNPKDSGLHNISGSFEVVKYDMDNSLYKHGPLKISEDKRHFAHLDNTPYLWLSDTWWMSLCDRASFNKGDFQKLATDRVLKGFNTIFIVMGLYPDMNPFDKSGANEAGFPYIDKEYNCINPKYFDYADIKINYLIDVNLMPCLFGCWGYFSYFMGVEKLKKFWRYIIARYAAYPVAFSYAGESSLPFYSHKLWGKWEEYDKKSVPDWSEIAKYARSIEPFNRLFTIHPPTRDFTYNSKNLLDDYSLVDFNMMQTCHGSLISAEHSVKSLRYAYNLTPPKPILIGEGYYEGILEQSREEVQRWFFFSSIFSGAAGHGYGANGIWQLNEENKPFRGNPNNTNWGDTTWEDAMNYNGSKQIGLGRQFLLKFKWHKFTLHQEWCVFDGENNGFEPYATGIKGEIRMFYYSLTHAPLIPLRAVGKLENNIKYRAYFVNPSDFKEYKIGEVTPDSKGEWQVPQPPTMRDWILVLKKTK